MIETERRTRASQPFVRRDLGRTACAAALAVAIVGACCSAAAASDRTHGAVAPVTNQVPNPTLVEAAGGRGEASGGLRYDVTEYGYTERELYFEGTAKSYLSPALEPAPYRSRMIAWTPTDPSAFNGVTLVEWAHVSDFGQFELTVEINQLSPMLEAEGYAYVLVSAEEGGVCDRRPDGTCTATSLMGADPDRYGSLHHPGDAYASDIFSQAMQAIVHPSGASPLGALDSEILVASGFQPSIEKWIPGGLAETFTVNRPFGINGPLNAYLATGADADAQIADAFLIDAAASGIEPASFRVPTLHHLDESAIRRTPSIDRQNHVSWEVTGAAHLDRWNADHTRIPSSGPPAPKLTRVEEEARRDLYGTFGLEPFTDGDQCVPSRSAGNLFPRRFTLNAALDALVTWVQTGTPAPPAPRIERVGPNPESPSTKLERDTDGNAIGGLRLPIIGVPVAAYNGETCVMAGTTIAFPAEEVASRYETHERYVDQLLAATDAAVAARLLRCEEARTIMHKASASTLGGPDPYAATPRCGAPPPEEPPPDPGPTTTTAVDLAPTTTPPSPQPRPVAPTSTVAAPVTIAPHFTG